MTTRELTYSAAFAEGVAEEMATDPDILVIGTDLVERGGHWAQVKGLAQQMGPGRVYDTPISEAAMVATGVGAAVAGLHPIVDLNFIDFAFGAMDEIANQAAKVQWQRSLRVNLTGYFLCARSAGRAMIDAGAGGSIINISSIAGVSGLGRGNFAYSVTKGGITQMTRELAVEWGRYGIRVNAILPVQTRTKGFQVRLDHPDTNTEPFLERLLRSIPLGRLAEPGDFVGPAVFLASDAAAMVSGVLLPVDGGNLAMNAGARSDE